jgi:dephospho-CoA kinase
MTLKIGLTGGIGSGKTTVAKIFETLRVPVYYADDAAKKLMNEHPELRQSLIAYFGPQAYTSSGLNRSYIAAQVFNNPGKLSFLNALVHPVTMADADAWMQKQTADYAVKEAALFFETDAWKHVDKIIGVSAPLELRLQRIMKRDGLTKPEVQKRMDRQMDEKEKMDRCDFVIINDEQQMLIPQVLALDQLFRQQKKD